MKYPHGDIFPSEGFVQKTVEAYFINKGFNKVKNSDGADFECIDSKGNGWLIEAKGDTGSNVGTDFKTGLGQIIQKMKDEEATKKYRYGIAVPKIKSFIKQVKMIKKWTRTAINLHILLININAEIEIIDPSEKI